MNLTTEQYYVIALIVVIVVAYLIHKSSTSKFQKTNKALKDKISKLNEENAQLEKKVEELEYKCTNYYQVTKKEMVETATDSGTQGEYALYKELRSFESMGKFLFNLYIPKADGTTTEVDMLFIHPTGIYIFENKNYSGWIFGNQKDKLWTEVFKTGDKFRFYNPVMQNDGHIKYLRYFLQESLPFCSVVVFSGSGTLKNVTVTRTDVCLTTIESVKAYLEKVLINSRHFLTSQQIERIYNKLYPLTQADEVAKLQHAQNVKSIQTGQSVATAPFKAPVKVKVVVPGKGNIKQIKISTKK